MKKKPSEHIESLPNDTRKNIWKAAKNELAEKTLRTTFRLTKEANEALNWLVEDHRYTLKSVIDLLCLNVNLGRDSDLAEDTVLSSVIKLSKSFDFGDLDRSVRRTMAVSDKSIRILNHVSRKFGIQRDFLVDRGALFLKSLFEQSKEEEKRNHQEAFELIDKFYTSAKDLEDKLLILLDIDDPIRVGFSIMVARLEYLRIDIKNEIEKGMPIDPDLL